MLKQETTVEFEYKNYSGSRILSGRLRFHCLPSEELIFSRSVDWPEILREKECDSAVLQGIVDGLFMKKFYPYTGCKLECVEIGWHEVHSVVAAYYFAAFGAMQELRAKGSWDITPRKNSPNS
ncbi:MAG TPA: hypothetical protein PK530_21005 [Anaerolineales bacterium]|nr:hypothetical protein [Anaerolineales bacterium]